MAELKYDPRNYRIHTDKNKRLIRKSLEDCGAGRSILFDKNDCIIAGSGVYRSFVPDTIAAFQEAGLHYYNEMILVNNIGSLAMRAGKQFSNSRKIGKQHQNVLVFYKGDLSKIKENFPELDFSNDDLFKED